MNTKVEDFVDTVAQIAQFLNGEGDAGNIASRRLRAAIAKFETEMGMPSEIEDVLRSRTRRIKISALRQLVPDACEGLRSYDGHIEVQLDPDPEFGGFIIQMLA